MAAPSAKQLSCPQPVALSSHTFSHLGTLVTSVIPICPLGMLEHLHVVINYTLLREALCQKFIGLAQKDPSSTGGFPPSCKCA